MRAPVITSNGTSLAEVAGDAAILVNPELEEEISEAMLRIYESEGLREKMKAKGLEQAKKFSWKDCVDRMLEVYNSFRGV